MPARDIVVVGGSAGGVAATVDLVRALPRDLPAAVFVALHLSSGSPGLLPGILSRVGAPQFRTKRPRGEAPHCKVQRGIRSYTEPAAADGEVGVAFRTVVGSERA